MHWRVGEELIVEPKTNTTLCDNMTFNFWRIYQAHHYWGMHIPYHFSYCPLPTHQSCYALWLKEQTENSTLYSDHHLPPPSPSFRMDGTTYVDSTSRSTVLQIMHIEYKIDHAPFVFIMHNMILLLRGHRGWRYSSRNLCIYADRFIQHRFE